MHTQAIINEFVVTPFNDSVVTVRLLEIQHQAQRGDEVDDTFTISLIVNGAGESLNYIDTVTVSAGNSKSIVSKSNNFNYNDTSCNGIAQKDLYFVATAAANNSPGFNSFMGNAKGKLKAGTLNFSIPIVIENGNKKSTIRLRGTIHVSCPNV